MPSSYLFYEYLFGFGRPSKCKFYFKIALPLIHALVIEDPWRSVLAPKLWTRFYPCSSVRVAVNTILILFVIPFSFGSRRWVKNSNNDLVCDVKMIQRATAWRIWNLRNIGVFPRRPTILYPNNALLCRFCLRKCLCRVEGLFNYCNYSHEHYWTPG